MKIVPCSFLCCAALWMTPLSSPADTGLPFETSAVERLPRYRDGNSLRAWSAPLGSVTLFAGTDDALFRTDGTTEGTRPVLPVSSAPGIKVAGDFTVFQGKAWFIGATGPLFTSYRLCYTDGTAGGTGVVGGIDPKYQIGGIYVAVTYANGLPAPIISQNVLICGCNWNEGNATIRGLFAYDPSTTTHSVLPVTGYDKVLEFNGSIYLETWPSDLQRVRHNGTVLEQPQNIMSWGTFYPIVKAGSGLYRGGSPESKLMRFDGSQWVACSPLLASPGFGATNVSALGSIGNNVFFNVEGGNNFPENTGLWVMSDPAGTPRKLTGLAGRHLIKLDDGRVALLCETPQSKIDLWVFDGQSAEFVGNLDIRSIDVREMVFPVRGGLIVQVDFLEMLVTDLTPGKFRPIPGWYGNGAFRLADGRTILAADFRHKEWTEYNREAWILDDIASAPRLLKELSPMVTTRSGLFGSAGGKLIYFNDQGIWSSDGTAGGKRYLSTMFAEGVYSASQVGDKLFFSGSNEWQGTWAYRTDGTPPGSAVLANISHGANSFTPAAGDRVYMVTGLGVALAEPGLPLVIPKGDLDPIQYLPGSATGSSVYFAQGTQLWRGTATGVQKVRDPGTPAGEVAIFTGPYPNGSDMEPWRTDGTNFGTYRLVDANPGLSGSSMMPPVRVGSDWWFITRDHWTSNEKLWRSDGTITGTQMLVALPAGPPGNAMANYGQTPVAMGGRIFWQSGGFLWRSDGTAEGTLSLARALAGGPMAVWENRLFFRGYADETGNELWTSDGTPEGTFAVEDLKPGPGDGVPASAERFVVAGDRLYYQAMMPLGTGQIFPQLRVVDTVSPVSYQAWATNKGLSGGAAAPLANPSGDSVPNLLKYAFNLNPLQRDTRALAPLGTAGLPVISAKVVEGMNAVEISWLKRVRGGVIYTVERSADGLGWEPVTAPMEATRVAQDLEHCTVTLPADGAQRLLRVRVSMEP